MIVYVSVLPLINVFIIGRRFMEILYSILLGIVQGLTEFLPISSSGHLFLFKNIFGDAFGNPVFTESFLFDMCLHCGTLAALIVVFYKDIIKLFKPPFKTIGLLLLASVPGIIMLLLFGEQIDGFFREDGAKFICFCFLFTAALLFITEMLSKHREKIGLTANGGITDRSDGAVEKNPVRLKNALIMGFAQAVAIVPGVSRSGSTISAGVLSGANRKDAAKFSFFMSAIAIAGSVLIETIKVINNKADMSADILPIILGTAAAAVSGLFALKFMMKLVEKSNFKWFSLYLVIIFILTFIDGFIVTNGGFI